MKNSRPPKADILLLRREGKAWNASQRARLPDGVRDSAANHVLIEFKYTESVNTTALRQAIVYDHLYRQAQKLPEGALLTIVLSAKTPRKDSLDSWAYSEVKDGVFRSSNPFLENVMLLVTACHPRRITQLSSFLQAEKRCGRQPLQRWTGQ